jgi:MoaA/NifB/PqqE/SkfB family radical SAM enzyme
MKIRGGLSDILKASRRGFVWIFITDKCNLHCDYCFFKCRTNKTTLSINKLKTFIQSVEFPREYNFVISGGEPLLEWKITKQALAYIRNRYPQNSLLLQTNLISVTKEMQRFFRRYRILVELSLDGRFAVNYRHRRGLTQNGFKTILNFIKSALHENIRMNPTLAIHPHESGELYDNFQYLVSLGLYSIDVHPVLFGAWHNKHIGTVIEQYKEIVKLDLKNHCRLLNRDYNIPKGNFLDLIVMPDGNILPNWTFLVLPNSGKNNFYFSRVTDYGIEIDEERLIFYLKHYYNFFKHHKSTYREFSNLNVELMFKNYHLPKYKLEHFSVYKEICERIKRIDRCYMLANKSK